MASKMQVYKCGMCGNITEVLHGGPGELVCCGQPMELLEEKTADKTTEKHVPVIEKTEKGYRVTVGTTLHPMVDAHYIEWIELLVEGVVHRAYLNPGDEPSAEFCVKAGEVSAREFCNVHLLWKG